VSFPAAHVPENRDDEPHDDAIVLLTNLAWADFERLLEARGDRSGPRMAFLDGAIEIMAPSPDHERVKSYLAGLVEAWCLASGVDVVPFGSWTLKDEEEGAGLEPDECYVVGAEPKPRPDLAIEVVWTSGRMSKLEIYRRLRVPEVWTWRRGALHVHVLRGDRYEEATASEVLPGIDLQLVLSLLARPTLTQAQRELMAAVTSRASD
jgi:Uma2 family endonuclease